MGVYPLPPTAIVVSTQQFERDLQCVNRVVASLGSSPESGPSGNRQERRKRRKAERTARKRGR